MRFGIFPTAPLVHLHIFASVNRQGTVWIDGDQKQARVRLIKSLVESEVVAQMTYIDQVGLVSHMDIMDHRGFVQVSELCHIVCLVELGRVYFINGLRIDLSLLNYCQQCQQVPLQIRLSYAPVVTLHKQTAITELLDYPSPHER